MVYLEGLLDKKPQGISKVGKRYIDLPSVDNLHTTLTWISFATVLRLVLGALQLSLLFKGGPWRLRWREFPITFQRHKPTIA